MLLQYVKNPATVKYLAAEIKKVTDDYWSRKISEETAKEYLLYWGKIHGDKLFMGSDLNPTIKLVIGKKRVKLINIWLTGTQFTIFN